MLSLPAERYPNVNFGEVIIATYFPGASPDEVETLVTRKIEQVLEAVEDVEWIKATSYRERSHLRLKFFDDSDYEGLYNEVRFKVLSMLEELPQDIDPPVITDVKISDWLPVVVVNLSGDHENRALALMAEELKTPLLRIPGVREVSISGEYLREFHVYLDPRRLKALGVSFDEVARALQIANVSIPAGDFSDGSGEFLVKVDEKFRSREQVISTVIRRDADGSFVRVGDVISRAQPSYRDPIVISSVNGRDSLALQVKKTSAGNALQIKAEVERMVEEFRPGLARQGVQVVLTQDSTVYIEDALSTLGMNMLVGMVLVSALIWYFMGIRNAALTTIGIPFAFMITMLIMYLTGNSLNEITLFAFVLVTGILVDDAIVVVENIYRHVQQGMALQKAIVSGTAEVALPVISATMTTVAAFLPMLIMTGSTGEFFAEIPKAVSFAIVASLIECLLILPIHYLDFGPRPKRKGVGSVVESDNALLGLLRSLTETVLSLTMRFRISSLVAVMLVFALAVAILGVSISGKIPLIRIKFFPDDYSIYYVVIEGPSSTPIEEIDRRVKKIAEFIAADGPGMAASAAGFAGFTVNEDYEEIFGNNMGTVMVTLPSKNEQRFADPLEHLDDMRRRLRAEFEEEGFSLRVNAQKEGPPRGKDINVRVVGNNFEAVRNLAEELLHFLRDHARIGPHLLGLEDDRGQPKRVFRFEVMQERAHEYGLDASRVAQLAGSVLDGRYIGKYRLADEEVDMKLGIDPQFLREPEDALYIPLVEHATGPVLLGDLTEVRTYLEPGELNRYQGQRAVSIKANIKPGAPVSIPAVVDTVKTHYESIRDRYPGATVVFGGEYEDTRRSYRSLAYAFIIAVMLMYVILATQFQSYLQPLIILSAIVFSLIGVVFGKLVTQSLFTVNSFIAVIGVAGVVVNDALVLVNFINKRYRAGLTRREAIDEGVRVRLRPIVLTTLTTTLGLLPMAVGFPSYSLIWGTMASTFVTGLATATALILFLVPVLWDLLTGWQERRSK
jgi:HAE1 family hydrophobic/amphiphilic exporter-1